MTDRPTLQFPAYDFAIREADGKTQIFDFVRRKYVRLTPEEWVRQHLLAYLVHDLGTPAALVAVEAGFTYQGMAWRADVVAYDRRGRPLLLAECKAPEVAVRQATFDQAARYNKVVGAPYLVVTNGRVHYVAQIDHAAGAIRFLDALPDYEAL